MQTTYAGGAKKLVITTKARLSRSKQKVGAYASPPSSIGLSTEAGYIEQNSIMIGRAVRFSAAQTWNSPPLALRHSP